MRCQSQITKVFKKTPAASIHPPHAKYGQYQQCPGTLTIVVAPWPYYDLELELTIDAQCSYCRDGWSPFVEQLRNVVVNTTQLRLTDFFVPIEEGVNANEN